MRSSSRVYPSLARGSEGECPPYCVSPGHRAGESLKESTSRVCSVRGDGAGSGTNGCYFGGLSRWVCRRGRNCHACNGWIAARPRRGNVGRCQDAGLSGCVNRSGCNGEGLRIGNGDGLHGWNCTTILRKFCGVGLHQQRGASGFHPLRGAGHYCQCVVATRAPRFHRIERARNRRDNATV